MEKEQGPKNDALDSEQESKLSLESRSSERSHSTEHGTDDDPITEINVTPLVDVSLVLVIIFMAVSPFMLQAGLTVTESKSGAAKGKASLTENVQVTLTPDNKIMLNGNEILLADLNSALKEAIKKSKDGLVTLQADKTNRVGQVVEILDIAKQAGAKKVALLDKHDDKEKESGKLPVSSVQ